MNPAALIFLEDERARQLTVAWEACKGHKDKWLNAAGLKTHPTIQRTCDMLLMNNICQENGVVDTLAMQYITRLATKALRIDDKKIKEKS
jgi:hypothetical protein